MSNMSKTKRNTLLFLSLAGMLMLLLAMSLPTIVLLSGKPLSFGQPVSGAPNSASILPGGDILVAVFQGIISLGLIALIIEMVYSIFSPAGRRRLMFYAIMVLLVFLFVNFLYSRRQQLADLNLSNNATAVPQGGDPAGAVPSIDRFPKTPPSWLNLAIIGSVSVISALAVLALFYFWRRREPPATSPLERLAQEAQTAIDSIQSGGDFRSTIIRCYEEMNRVVKEERGIAREATMTPREFEERLINQGLGRDAVETLTRLFEKSRYGSMSASTGEETQAVDSLTAIVNSIKGQLGPDGHQFA